LGIGLVSLWHIQEDLLSLWGEFDGGIRKISRAVTITSGVFPLYIGLALRSAITDDQTSIDFPQVCKMADAFLGWEFLYFDTA
jgi:hypothetical protein